MAIKYRTEICSNGHPQTHVELDDEIDYRSLCDYIGENSTLKLERSHVEHVLSRAVNCIIELVSKNCSVKVDDLGKFQPRVGVRKGKVELSVLFTPSVPGFLRRLKREKCVELKEDWNPYPIGEPITTYEKNRRLDNLRKLNTE